MNKYIASLASVFLFTSTIAACAQDAPPPIEPVAQGQKELYLPKDEKDYSGNDHEYSMQRHVETPNIAMFWAKEYGDDPAANPNEAKRFDVNGVLNECERFYQYYVNDLKFVEKGNSVTDKYKVVIYIVGGDGGTAFGGGIENKIGALWTPASRINKAPYGVMAHELGHSFQYLVHADGNWGFSSLPAGSKGQSTWEMTSQYMLWQVYPQWVTFENYHLNDFMQRTNLAFMHEDNQYHSPFVLEYWSEKRGVDFIGKIWRQAREGEDMPLTYKRLTGVDQSEFNDEMFEASRHFITWDMPRIEKASAPYANQHTTSLDTQEDGWYQIAANRAPQNYGYNAIQLKVPAAGTTVKLDFKGIAGADGFRAINVDKAGWRYGFVASMDDGSRVYSPIFSKSTDTVSFAVPAQTQFLWLVVSGAPTEHWIHLVDNDASTDEQWPYQIRLSGTSPDASVLDLSKRNAD